jgi:hypothetical protein
MLEPHTHQRPQRHCSPNNALVHLVTDAHFPARLSRRKSILHAPISIGKKARGLFALSRSYQFEHKPLPPQSLERLPRNTF